MDWDILSFFLILKVKQRNCKGDIITANLVVTHCSTWKRLTIKCRHTRHLPHGCTIDIKCIHGTEREREREREAKYYRERS